MPSPHLRYGTKQKSAKYTLKSRDQVTIKHECGKRLRYQAFSIILISLRVEMRQISDFLVHAKILPL